MVRTSVSGTRNWGGGANLIQSSLGGGFVCRVFLVQESSSDFLSCFGRWLFLF